VESRWCIPGTENVTLGIDGNGLPELSMDGICDRSSLVKTDLK